MTAASSTRRAAVGPGPLGAGRTVYGVLLRAQLRTGRVLGLLGLVVVGALLGLAAAGAADQVEAGAQLVGTFGLGVVVPVGALLVASSTLGDQVEDKTAVYLLLRPVPRWVVAVAAWAAAATVVVPLTVGGSAAAAAVVGDPDLTRGAAWSSLLGAVAYSAVFTWLGLTARRALMWGLAYVLIWEGFVAAAGEGLASLALRSWTRSVLSDAVEVDLRLADRSPGLAVVVCVAVTVVFMGLTARALDRREIE